MTSNQRTLAEALLSAGAALGLARHELGIAIGQDITTVERAGLDPASPAGLRALLLIRIYVRLFELIGDSTDSMRHWMHTANRALGAVPADLVISPSGLARVVEYLEACS